MGKGVGGCTEAMEISWSEPAQQQLAELVNSGASEEAFELLSSHHYPYQVWREMIDEMVYSENDPEKRSMYRHLLAAMLFSRGMEGRYVEPVSDAKVLLQEDLRDPQTSEEWRTAARGKLAAIHEEFGYEPRYLPGSAGRRTDSETLLGVQEARERVSLLVEDEAQEMDLIERTFGDQAAVFPPPGERWEDAAATRTGIPGALIGAVHGGRPFVIRPGSGIDDESLSNVLEASEEGEEGFCLIVMVSEEQPQIDFDWRCDFTDWRELAIR